MSSTRDVYDEDAPLPLAYKMCVASLSIHNRISQHSVRLLSLLLTAETHAKYESKP